MGSKEPGRRIEVAYPEGTRTLRVPAGATLMAAAMLAQEIWDEERGKVDVRLMSRNGGGDFCVCHLPPE